MKKHMGEIGLFTIAIIWGSGFIGTKLALDGGVSAIQTLTVRFFVASLILGTIFFKEIKKNISKESLRSGALLGVFSFIGFSMQTIGLVYTTISKNAFITAANVVIVTFIGFILYKRKLDKIGIISSFIALLGIGILSLQADFSVNLGDVLTFLCAFGFAFHIFFTGEFTSKYNAYVLTVTQFVVAFILSALLQIFTKQVHISATPTGIMGALYLGIFSFIGFSMQTIGLVYTTISKNAFITAANVVIVPFIGFILYKRKLDKIGIISSFIALLGIGILSLQADFSVNLGDVLTFLCAFGFAFHIFFTGEFTAKYNAYVLTVTQFVVAFILSALLQIFTNQVNINATPTGIMGALYLGIFSTAIAFLLQTICQSKVEQTRSALILSTESLFGTILSVIFLHEVVTIRMVVGCMIIFTSIIISETKLSFLKKKVDSPAEER